MKNSFRMTNKGSAWLFFAAIAVASTIASATAENGQVLPRGVVGLELGDSVPSVEKKATRHHLRGATFSWKGEEWKHYHAMDPSKVSYANRKEFDREEAKVQRTFECGNDEPFEKIHVHFTKGAIDSLEANYRNQINAGDSHEVRVPAEMIPSYSAGTHYLYGEFVSDDLNDIVSSAMKKYGKPLAIQDKTGIKGYPVYSMHDYKTTAITWADKETILELMIVLKKLNLPATGLSWDAKLTFIDERMRAERYKKEETATKQRLIGEQRLRDERKKKLVP